MSNKKCNPALNPEFTIFVSISCSKSPVQSSQNLQHKFLLCKFHLTDSHSTELSKQTNVKRPCLQLKSTSRSTRCKGERCIIGESQAFSDRAAGGGFWWCQWHHNSLGRERKAFQFKLDPMVLQKFPFQPLRVLRTLCSCFMSVLFQKVLRISNTDYKIIFGDNSSL